jgi:cation diffusion facilitator family transporter
MAGYLLRNLRKERLAIDREKQQHRALHVARMTIAGNVALTAFKLAAGVLAHSGAMLSDAAHSASDILSTLVVMLGIRVSCRERDENHPYGHERMECVAAVVLSGILLLTGAVLGIRGVRTILTGLKQGFVVPGSLALAAALVSIVSKEAMYHYTKNAARAIRSTALMADAWHHRSDALSSVGSLLGIGGAMLGYPIMDPIASIVIAFLIVKVSLDIARQAFDQMLDRACPLHIEEALHSVALEQTGVRRIDSLTTRQFGARYYVDICIAADGHLTLSQGHDIAQAVHLAVEQRFPDVKHCMVHVNPYPGED